MKRRRKGAKHVLGGSRRRRPPCTSDLIPYDFFYRIKLKHASPCFARRARTKDRGAPAAPQCGYPIRYPVLRPPAKLFTTDRAPFCASRSRRHATFPIRFSALCQPAPYPPACTPHTWAEMRSVRRARSSTFSSAQWRPRPGGAAAYAESTCGGKRGMAREGKASPTLVRPQGGFSASPHAECPPTQHNCSGKRGTRE